MTCRLLLLHADADPSLIDHKVKNALQEYAANVTVVNLNPLVNNNFSSLRKDSLKAVLDHSGPFIDLEHRDENDYITMVAPPVFYRPLTREFNFLLNSLIF